MTMMKAGLAALLALLPLGAVAQDYGSATLRMGSFNVNNMPIQNYYAFQVVKENDKPVSKLIGTPLTDHKDTYFAKCAAK